MGDLLGMETIARMPAGARMPVAMGSLVRNTMALVLAGGRGSRLKELTDRRAKPAVHFGGTGRIIDFALSNAINSGIRRIGVATQYKAHSLISHLQKSWTFLRSERNETFDILPASQRTDDGQWYQGTADAVYQNLDILERYPIEHVIILAGDHVYKMDYTGMLAQHAESGADVTVGVVEVPRAEAASFGVVRVDEQDRIDHFVEKPNDPPAIPGDPERSLASMGIYVFSAGFLYDQLRRDAAQADSQHDFGRDLIPWIVRHGLAVAHRFSRSAVRTAPQAQGYWRDVGTLDAYFAANLDLISVTPALDLYDQRWPIWTSTAMLPPAKFVHDEEGRRGLAISSLAANGSIVSGATVRCSLLSTGVRVSSFADVENAVIMPHALIGRGARLRNVIVDSRVSIPPGLTVGADPALDARRFRRTGQGVCLITQDMIDRLA